MKLHVSIKDVFNSFLGLLDESDQIHVNLRSKLDRLQSEHVQPKVSSPSGSPRSLNECVTGLDKDSYVLVPVIIDSDPSLASSRSTSPNAAAEGLKSVCKECGNEKLPGDKPTGSKVHGGRHVERAPSKSVRRKKSTKAGPALTVRQLEQPNVSTSGVNSSYGKAARLCECCANKHQVAQIDDKDRDFSRVKMRQLTKKPVRRHYSDGYIGISSTLALDADDENEEDENSRSEASNTMPPEEGDILAQSTPKEIKRESTEYFSYPEESAYTKCMEESKPEVTSPTGLVAQETTVDRDQKSQSCDEASMPRGKKPSRYRSARWD